MLKQKVLVVDLDGTLFSINTFHHFLKFLTLHCFKTFNIILLFKIVSLIKFRIVRLISHSYLKYKILSLIKDKSDIDYNQFVANISKYKSDIKELNNSYDIKILATAAPLCYAEIIAKNYGFNLCSATQSPKADNNNFTENIREAKLLDVMHLLSQNEISEVDTLITDHIDDLPLMKVSIRNIIVNPSQEFTSKLNSSNIQFEILKLK